MPRRPVPFASPGLLVARRRMQMGITYGNLPNTDGLFPNTDAQRNILKAAALHQFQFVHNVGVAVGATATSTTPFADYDGLAAPSGNPNGGLDQRVARMEAARAPGGSLGLILAMAPHWMAGLGPTDFSAANNTRVQDANVQKYAEWCAFLAQRYPQVTDFVVWSEGKGYYGADPGAPSRWGYQKWTELYNAVYTAIKAVRPDAKVGGPYTTTRQALDFRTGIPTLASNGTSVQMALKADGMGSHIDARLLDVWLYWKANCAGYDFLAFDGWMHQRWDTGTGHRNEDAAPQTPWAPGTPNTVTRFDSGHVVFDDRDKLGKFAKWVRDNIDKEAPLYCVETYFHDGTRPNFLRCANSMAPYVDRMYSWLGPEEGTAGYLWPSGGSTPTELANAMADWTAGRV